MGVEPTDEELNILSDDHFMVVKQTVSDKIIAYLARIEREIHQYLQQSDFPFPEQAFIRTGKISKGENYRSLPFFILDYPRMFSKTDVFAFRSMIWWGHEFSCTIHLSGDPLQRVKKELVQRLKNHQDLYFCVHPDPWEYHYDQDNYRQVKQLDEKTMNNHIESNHFIKLSDKISLKDWNQYAGFTLKTLNRFLSILH